MKRSSYGATVVKVESQTHVDAIRITPPYMGEKAGINRSGFFNTHNAGKYTLSLNLLIPKAVEIAKRLVQLGDVGNNAKNTLPDALPNLYHGEKDP